MARTNEIRKQRRYPYPPERVWVALTDPHALAEWLMPNNFVPEVGHKFRFHCDPMPGSSGITDCEVLELDPPRRMVWSWTIVRAKGKKPLAPMRIEWTLKPDGGGTLLTLVHSYPENTPRWVRLSMGFGWGTMVKRWIPKVVENVGEDGSFTPGAIPLKKRCYKVKTVPDSMTY